MAGTSNSRPSEDEKRRQARELAIAAYVVLKKRERRTAKALILAERRTLKAIKAAAKAVAAHAVAQLAMAAGDGTSLAPRVIRQAVPTMSSALERELLAARRGARTIARTGLLQELDVEVAATTAAIEEDAAAAHVAANSLASAWGQRAIANAGSVGDGGPYRSAARAVAEAFDMTDGRLRRTAATESADAFNDERGRIYDDFGDQPGAFKVWSAVLDGRTCPECWAIDGKTIPIDRSFGKSPPVHPWCRCAIEHVIIPKPQRLEDTSIDYELFKQEMRDVVREGRAIDRQYEDEPGKRHAIRFVRDSQTDRKKFGRSVRSSTVLTEKYTNATGDYEVRGDLSFRRRRKVRP